MIRYNDLHVSACLPTSSRMTSQSPTSPNIAPIKEARPPTPERTAMPMKRSRPKRYNSHRLTKKVIERKMYTLRQILIVVRARNNKYDQSPIFPITTDVPERKFADKKIVIHF